MDNVIRNQIRRRPAGPNGYVENRQKTNQKKPKFNLQKFKQIRSAKQIPFTGRRFIKNDLALTSQSTKLIDNTNINSNYLKALQFPETAESARIPSRYPLESATFHKHMTIKLNTNTFGNMALLFNPYYLYDTTTTTSGLGVDTSLLCTLTTPDIFVGYTGVSLPFALPINTYSDYRLVSCSMKIICNTPNLNATGIMGGGLIAVPGIAQCDSFVVGSNAIKLNGDMTIQANIDQAMYFKQADISKHEDLRIVYYPFDPSYENFVDVNKNRTSNGVFLSNQLFCAYISAAAASTAFTLELDYNFECLIYPLAKGFIPLGITGESFEAGRAVRVLVSEEANITQAGSNINQVLEKEEQSFVTKLLNVGTKYGKMALKHLPEMLAML